MKHEWARVYNDRGEPLVLMQCSVCGEMWEPHQSERDLGSCVRPAAVVTPATSEQETK